MIYPLVGGALALRKPKTPVRMAVFILILFAALLVPLFCVLALNP